MSLKIKGLDGLRGISVLLVIMSHAVIWPVIGVTNPALLSVLSPHVGVSTFFVLSGFLITFLLIKEKESTGRVDIFSFIKRRALRIFSTLLSGYFLPDNHGRNRKSRNN
jgi:peptidoglycan/LPS O-acetylase OafA/YrhL